MIMIKIIKGKNDRCDKVAHEKCVTMIINIHYTRYNNPWNLNDHVKDLMKIIMNKISNDLCNLDYNMKYLMTMIMRILEMII